MMVLVPRWLLGRRALAAGLLAVALTASAVTVGAAPALATQASPSTNDQSTTVNTAWWAYNGVTASQVGSLLTTNSARLTQIRVENPAVPTFDVTMVSNSGVYASGWWWYYGLTGSQVSSTLTTNNARLISLEPYVVGGSLRFAVVEVPNTGAQGRAWWWYYGESASNLVNLMLNNGERLIDITPYSSGGTTVYAGVGLDNTNVLQSPINTTSTNVDSYAAANGWGGGLFGAYLAPTSSPGSPLVAFNSGYRFEPANTIKVLYLLYALKQVQAGADSLSSSFTYYVSPSDPTNPGVCPQQSWEVPANAVTTTLGNALQLMMYNSDNRVTRGMEERYGIANVQAMAASLGLSHTSLAQPFIGCTFQGAVRNELTASDVARLYSLVKQKLELNAQYTKLFFNDELGGVPSSTDYLVTVIDQEAAKLGKSSQVAAAFASQVVNHWKAGGYVICMASDCSAYKADYSVAGVLTLPAKTTTGTVVPKSYAYSDFVNDLYVPCKWNSGCAADTAAGAMIGHVVDEAARPAIDKALKNW
jgi:hypothetical protein